MNDDLDKDNVQTSKEYVERIRQDAIRAHENDQKQQDRLFSSTIDMAGIAIKTVTLVTGGSAVVSLAFVGNLFGTDKILAMQLMPIVFIFSIGVVLGGISAGFAYLAQFYYLEASGHKKYTWDHPYIEQIKTAEPMIAVGKRWHLASVFIVILSYISVIAGVGYAWNINCEHCFF